MNYIHPDFVVPLVVDMYSAVGGKPDAKNFGTVGRSDARVWKDGGGRGTEVKNIGLVPVNLQSGDGPEGVNNL